jgi:hypothetical protein
MRRSCSGSSTGTAADMTLGGDASYSVPSATSTERAGFRSSGNLTPVREPQSGQVNSVPTCSRKAYINVSQSQQLIGICFCAAGCWNCVGDSSTSHSSYCSPSMAAGVLLRLGCGGGSRVRLPQSGHFSSSPICPRVPYRGVSHRWQATPIQAVSSGSLGSATDTATGAGMATDAPHSVHRPRRPANSLPTRNVPPQPGQVIDTVFVCGELMPASNLNILPPL